MPKLKQTKPTLEGSKNFLRHQAELLANELRMDPFEIMSRFAIGDVVGLGMMTQKELDDKGTWSVPKAKWVKLPGKTIAWKHIPASVRFDAAKELLPYLYAKKQSITVTQSEEGKDKSDPSRRRVIITLPANGRDKT